MITVNCGYYKNLMNETEDCNQRHKDTISWHLLMCSNESAISIKYLRKRLMKLIQNISKSKVWPRKNTRSNWHIIGDLSKAFFHTFCSTCISFKQLN